MAESSQDRQLPATPRRLKKAREDGQVARSRDLGHLAVLGAGSALLAALAPQLEGWLRGLLAQGLRFDAAAVGQPLAMGERLAQQAGAGLLALLPLGAAVALLALAAGVLCGGWNFTLKPLEPKLEKLDPLSGLKRAFGLQQLSQTLKACLLSLVLFGAGALVLAQTWTQHAQLLALPLPAALAEGGALLRTGMFALGGVLVAFAIVDVPLQRQLHLRRLRMSVQELKQELKEVEGNAEVKSRRRQRAREIANRRMLAAVPKADLVVMNPTHFAVALKYDEASGRAPRVVAKGADLMAMRIRDLARSFDVPVLQAPPLARALFAHCELDQEIPARLFSAVAQVLAWVYGLRDAMAQGRVPAEPPTPEVPPEMDPNDPRFRKRPGRGPQRPGTEP